MIKLITTNGRGERNHQLIPLLTILCSDFMSKKSGDRVALHWAASEGDLAKANQLLKDGAPVDPQDEVR